MPARDQMDFNIGHNEETFDYFTKLAKYKKRQVQIQDQLIKERGIDVNDLQALHKAIQDSEQQAKQEFGL
jgi:hypothetical protein